MTMISSHHTDEPLANDSQSSDETLIAQQFESNVEDGGNHCLPGRPLANGIGFLGFLSESAGSHMHYSTSIPLGTVIVGIGGIYGATHPEHQFISGFIVGGGAAIFTSSLFEEPGQELREIGNTIQEHCVDY